MKLIIYGYNQFQLTLYNGVEGFLSEDKGVYPLIGEDAFLFYKRSILKEEKDEIFKKQ